MRKPILYLKRKPLQKKKRISNVRNGRGVSFLVAVALITGLSGAIPGGEALAERSSTNSHFDSCLAEEANASRKLEDLFTTVDLMDATITELQEEMTAGHLTSVQLTEMYIDRIRAYDEKLKLNSIISINPAALSDAAALDQERAEGKSRGPLHGIPIVVKANYDVAGMATSAGSNALAGMIASEDSFVVKRLKEAGAVILAQANMSEYATSGTDSRSTLGGVVHNAYDQTKTPAGSSGGTAVAVTCNFAAAGLGTDTGGSIRNPSSFSNIYGMRPSKGLTSISGVLPLVAPRDTTGPMARTAEDTALLLEAMAGSDPKDDFTLEADADSLRGEGYTDGLATATLKGKRIGYLKNSFCFETSYEGEVFRTEPDEKMQAMVNRTLANLRKAGAELVDLSEYIPEEALIPLRYGISDDTAEYDLNKFLYEKGDAAPYKTVKEIIASGSGINYSYLEASFMGEEELADSFEEMENPYSEQMGDYLRTPTWKSWLEARSKVSKILEEQSIDGVMYLSNFSTPADQATNEGMEHNTANYDYIFGPRLGLPEISIPMGFSDTDGEYTSEMPVGVYMFSGYGNEKTLLEIASAYEKQAGENIRRMPACTPALPDERLNKYLSELMEEVYTIDYAKYNRKPEGKVQLMLKAYEKANNVNLQDPYAVYEAAEALAGAYDNVITDLEASGVNPEWKEHTFGAPVWTWKGTGSATASFTCQDDDRHVRTLTAEVTGSVTRKATYSTPGQKLYTATVTLDGKTYRDTKAVTIYVYTNEWIKGVWYNRDGSQTYQPKGGWRHNRKGWWYQDSKGWYPKDQWQKIDGVWYYFDSAGYMAKNEWYDGYWLNRNGSWTYRKRAEWIRSGTGWKYRTSDWNAKNQWQRIDGNWYYFDSQGYVVTGNRNIGGKMYRFNSSGVWIG